MNLQILLPSKRLVDAHVDSIGAVSLHGSFCIKPRHVDYAAPVLPGILTYTADGAEHYVGTSDGVLVKAGNTVRVSVRDAVVGDDLSQLHDAVNKRLTNRSEQEHKTYQLAKRLEAILVKRFIELEEDPME